MDGVGRRGTPDAVRAESKGCRGDVGVHLGGPEHHHHGQGSTLFPRHRSRCQPASAGRDDASRLTALSWPLSSFGSWGTPAALLRKDGDGTASTLCASQRVAAIACIRVSACPTSRPGGGEGARAAEATVTLPVLGRDCSGSRGNGTGIRVERVGLGRPKGGRLRFESPSDVRIRRLLPDTGR